MNPIATVRGLRIVFYIRVSSDEQADRQTPQNQTDYLQSRFQVNLAPDAKLDPMTLIEVIVDEGVSGALPLDQRPGGRRILQLARAGAIDAVVSYRLDRLGRRLSILLNIDEELRKHGVDIVSATEPFDTRTPFGRAVFQLLGMFAELERETIRERFIVGRNRHGHAGEFNNGPVPFGYDLDLKTCRLVPSDRMVEGVDMTEADLVRLLFERIAGGESASAMTLWLRSQGVPSTRRYIRRDGGESEQVSDEWNAVRLQKMVHAPLYKGQRTLKYETGPILQDVPPLVTEEVWDKANATLTGRVNNFNSGQGEGYVYLLSGKLFCSECGCRMVGNYQRRSNGPKLYYACGSARTAKSRRSAKTCNARKNYDGFHFEEQIMRKLDEYFANPVGAVAIMREQTRRRAGSATQQAQRAAQLRARLAEYERGKTALLGMVARGKLSEQAYDLQVQEADAEADTLQQELKLIESQDALGRLMESRLDESLRLLQNSRADWEAARAAGDRPTLRAIVQTTLGRFDLGPSKTLAHFGFDDPSLRQNNGKHYQELWRNDEDDSTSNVLDFGIHLQGLGLEPAA